MMPLDSRRLQQLCTDCKHVGTAIEVLEETPSTNDLAKWHLYSTTDSGKVFFAEHQTAGRGQYGRVWSAPKYSSLLFSVALRIPIEFQNPAFLIAWSAVSICETLRQCYSIESQIKWPNDVLISGRKTAGILVEKPGSGVVVGIGVNVSISESQWPTIMAYPATSIASELAGPVDRTELAGNLLCKLDERLEQCLHVGAEKLFEDWQGYFRHRAGDHVLATTRTGKVAGELVRVDPLMGAVIRTAGDYAERIDSQELISLTDG